MSHQSDWKHFMEATAQLREALDTTSSHRDILLRLVTKLRRSLRANGLTDNGAKLKRKRST